MKVSISERKQLKTWIPFMVMFFMSLSSIFAIILALLQKKGFFPNDVLNIYRYPPFIDATPLGMFHFAVFGVVVFSFAAVVTYPFKDETKREKIKEG